MYLLTENGQPRKAAVFLPLVLLILTSQTLNYCKSYADYNIFNLSHQETYAAGVDIIEQFKEAESQNLSYFQLRVTNNDSWGNIWPYPAYVGNTISDTLFRHGIIKRHIDCEIVYDEKKNEELGINY